MQTSLQISRVSPPSAGARHARGGKAVFPGHTPTPPAIKPYTLNKCPYMYISERKETISPVFQTPQSGSLEEKSYG